jgi:hypothetical protein
MVFVIIVAVVAMRIVTVAAQSRGRSCNKSSLNSNVSYNSSGKSGKSVHD